MTAVEQHVEDGRLETYAAGALAERGGGRGRRTPAGLPALPGAAGGNGKLSARHAPGGRARMRVERRAGAHDCWFRPVWALRGRAVALAVGGLVAVARARVPAAAMSVYLEATRGPEAPRVPPARRCGHLARCHGLGRGRGATASKSWTNAARRCSAKVPSTRGGRASPGGARGLRAGALLHPVIRAELLREYALESLADRGYAHPRLGFLPGPHTLDRARASER